MFVGWDSIYRRSGKIVMSLDSLIVQRAKMRRRHFVLGCTWKDFLEEEFEGLPEDEVGDLDLLTVAALIKHRTSAAPNSQVSQTHGNWARSSRLAGMGNWS